MKHAAQNESSCKLAARLFTIRRYPIRYLVIPKCGCTYVKNLLWTLESESAHGQPLRIHDDDHAFLRASDLNLTANEIRQERYAFTVLRRPLDRFFSLYTDKIIGKGRERFPAVAQLLNVRGGLDLTPSSMRGHERNLEILLDWVEQNIAEGVDLPRDPHWMPQMTSGREINEMRLHVLITSDLLWQLPMFLGNLIPGIETYLPKAERNSSRGDLRSREIIGPSLRKRIKMVYLKDQIAFQGASKRWQEVKAGLDVPLPRGPLKNSS